MLDKLKLIIDGVGLGNQVFIFIELIGNIEFSARTPTQTCSENCSNKGVAGRNIV